ncbi:MAG: hypothetical protein FIB01_05260 [Gemmatimonadetes bacterium]|nr:hypothetical protein [Gemmatimonadota bacterium]
MLDRPARRAHAGARLQLLRGLQDPPRLLEAAYDVTAAALRRVRRLLVPGSGAARFVAWTERVGKGAIFDCRMCGQCVLHATGMTCPMTCPKQLRNGPCGGVRADGHCEVHPERCCVWVQAWDRSRRMRACGEDVRQILPPLNHSLHDTSAWVNDLHRQELLAPRAWPR